MHSEELKCISSPLYVPGARGEHKAVYATTWKFGKFGQSVTLSGSQFANPSLYWVSLLSSCNHSGLYSCSLRLHSLINYSK